MYSASHAFHIHITALKNKEVNKKIKHEELIAKKSPNYRNPKKICTDQSPVIWVS